MRLLNCVTLQLKEYLTVSQCPAYAILSHTWGEEEILFEDIQRGRAQFEHKKGYDKLKGCCTQATKDGFEWAWIDTCCIDKSNSVELSEAINSMYLWYQRSSICYVFLFDVPLGSFWDSRWFTRGWTLQETIAPDSLEFYDSGWQNLGTKRSMQKWISDITGIPPAILSGWQSPESCSIAEKMSWAAQRKTSKPEDMAYCLMGVFHVNMPMLYGEGEYGAFYRLQRGIMEISEDHTLFTWWSNDGWNRDRLQPRHGLLANTPEAFRKTSEYDPAKLIPIAPAAEFIGDGEPPRLTGRGLRIQLALLPDFKYEEQSSIVALLDVKNSETDERASIRLIKSSEARSYQRLDHNFGFMAVNDLKLPPLSTVFVAHFNPGLEDSIPWNYKQHHLVASFPSRLVQLAHCVLYNIASRKRRIPPIRLPEPLKQGEWSVDLAGSFIRESVYVLIFQLMDQDDQKVGDAIDIKPNTQSHDAAFSVDVGLTKSYVPYCKITADPMMDKPSGDYWEYSGFERPGRPALFDGTNFFDRDKAWVSGHEVSVSVRRRAHISSDPPIPDEEEIAESLQRFYVYTLSVAIDTVLPAMGPDTPRTMGSKSPQTTAGASQAFEKRGSRRISTLDFASALAEIGSRSSSPGNRSTPSPPWFFAPALAEMGSRFSSPGNGSTLSSPFPSMIEFEMNDDCSI